MTINFKLANGKYLGVGSRDFQLPLYYGVLASERNRWNKCTGLKTFEIWENISCFSSSKATFAFWNLLEPKEFVKKTPLQRKEINQDVKTAYCFAAGMESSCKRTLNNRSSCSWENGKRMKKWEHRRSKKNKYILMSTWSKSLSNRNYLY